MATIVESPAPHLLNPLGKQLTPAQLFEDWLSVREHATYDRLSREAAEPYRYIWKSWCDWLTEEHASVDPLLYLKASQQDMFRYLRIGPSPASKRKSRSAPTSPLTRQRYGRVLRDIYRHAMDFGYATSSPVSDSCIGEAPSTIERSAQVLPQTVFESILAALPSDPTTYQKRDIAILLLLMDTAMTSAELCELELDAVRMNSAQPGQYLLRIDGPRGAQQREISTRGPTGVALHRWLAQRKVMRRQTNAVFVSEQKGSFKRDTLFRVVARFVTQACSLAGVDIPNHIGPSTIRNTAIVRWLNSGASLTDIQERTGIKDARTLLFRLKPHLTAVALKSGSNSAATQAEPTPAAP